MGCACGGGRGMRSTTTTGNWWVTTVTGEEKGPFLTATEARIEATASGGGTVRQIVK